MSGSLEQAIDELLEARVVLQRSKVLAVAKSIDARFTDDDVLQPHDYPALASDARFNYEDGVLAGLLAAQVAVRAHLRRELG